jgi:gliding motility-associated-like protein
LTVQPQNEGFTYEWQYNGVNVPDSLSTTFTIGKTGTVRVILRTDRGCRDSSAIVSIDSLPFPRIGILNDTTICERGFATFRVPFDSLYNYRWIDSASKNILSIVDTFVVSRPAKYYVEVFNFCNLVRDSASLIRVYPLPRFGILNNGRKDTLVCESLPVRLFGPIGYESYEWTSDSAVNGTGRQYIVPTNQLISFPLALTVQDEFGCSNSDTIRIKVIDCTPQIYVPTAFSPQGDKINDVWRLTGYDIQEFKVYVYNRWGQMVFFSEKIEPGWDGTFNGTPCASGAYKWIVEYKGSLDGEIVSKKETGTVTIIR